MSAGNYNITISGATDCQVVLSEEVIVENITLQTTVNTQNVQCRGENNGSLSIDNTSGGYPAYDYSLDGISYGSAQQIDSLAAGNYILYTRDNYGCTGQTSFQLTEPVFKLEIQAPVDTLLPMGVEMNAYIQQNTLTIVEYQWTPATGLSCINCQNPVITATESTVYTISGMDIQGCFDTTTFLLEVPDKSDVFIPNAFSPNNDGNNDILMIYSRGDVQTVKTFRIFDRWGEMVFESLNFQPNNYSYGWDGSFKGQRMNTGVYVYMAELLLINGRTEMLGGDVTLVR